MTEFTSELSVEHIHHMGSDATIARAARVSTKGLDAPSTKRDAGLIRRLWNDGHVSTFEHCTLTVAVDAPIFVAREWVRHRTFSFNESSARYREVEPRFYMPPDGRPLAQVGKAMDYELVDADPHTRRLVQGEHHALATQAWESYQEMLRRGVAREVARNVLPVSTYTQFYATANLRNWLHFLGLRTDDHAQWEIRQCAFRAEHILTNLFPAAMEVWHDGTDAR